MIPDSKKYCLRRIACESYRRTVLVNTNYPFRELPTESASHRNVFQDLNALRSVNLRTPEHRLTRTICELLTTLLRSSLGRGRDSLRALSANEVTSWSSPMNINAFNLVACALYVRMKLPFSPSTTGYVGNGPHDLSV
jgi:hypothetical protein